MKIRFIQIVFILAMVGCAILSQGQIRYKQYSPGSWPHGYDPNMIQNKFIGGIELPWGNTWSCDLNYSDPDNDPIIVNINAPPGFTISGSGKNWHWEFTPIHDQIGIHYIYTKITDVPETNDPNNPWDDPLSDSGTLIVIVRPSNNKPILAALIDLIF